jgi:hypothetical protein
MSEALGSSSNTAKKKQAVLETETQQGGERL